MNNQYEKIALNVIEIEAEAIKNLSSVINDDFHRACSLLMETKGHIIVTGMGKSGHIANKIAATLASTGTPAFFMHPAEAGHGDLGMVTANNAIIAISYSGNSPEICALIPSIRNMNIPIIAMTGNKESYLAKNSTVHIHIPISHEACPLGLAPTTSTTATLVLGDAIAVALLEAKQFNEIDFAHSHPAGALGKRLTLKAFDIAHTSTQFPSVLNTQSIKEALFEITAKKLGMTTVVNQSNQLLGIYTDGDVRRTFSKDINIHQTSIEQVMTPKGITITEDTLAFDALSIMKKHHITSLVIVKEQNIPVGVIHMHDILATGLM